MSLLGWCRSGCVVGVRCVPVVGCPLVLCWWSFKCSLGLCVLVLLVGPCMSLLVELQVLLGTVCPCFVGGAESVPVGGASGAPWDYVSLFCWWGRECPCWWSLRCSLGLCVPVLSVGPRVSLLVEPQVLLGIVCPCFVGGAVCAPVGGAAGAPWDRGSLFFVGGASSAPWDCVSLVLLCIDKITSICWRPCVPLCCW